MKEYAFDVKLWAVCRVKAATEKEARAKMLEVLECADIGFKTDDVELTEGSIEDGDSLSELIEIDGEAVD